jgi:hypothetical protein
MVILLTWMSSGCIPCLMLRFRIIWSLWFATVSSLEGYLCFDLLNTVSLSLLMWCLLFSPSVTLTFRPDITDVCLDESAVSSDPLLAFLLDEVVIKDWCKRAVNALISEICTICIHQHLIDLF